MTAHGQDAITDDRLRSLSARLRAVASQAAREVGSLLRDGFDEHRPASSKADFHDLVTGHDRLAEQAIRRHLAAAVPASRVIGEEEGITGSGDVTWYVDPIDGTNNFASGVPFFCVAIGAAYHGQLVAGVVYDPLREELFAADLRDATVNGSPMRSGGATHARGALLATDFPTHHGPGFGAGDRSDAERFGEMIREFRTVRRLGSGELTLAYVAAGRIDVTLGLQARPWDVAAGSMLVRAAGGAFVPLSAPEGDAPDWAAPSYLATVRGFDLASSCLADLTGARHD